ncbi:MAG TPA: hypothetical protein VGU63_05040 [Candidatus Acidoferrales bacterium]|nr:hypothetical protein [Candidatus Acidoferrales bacterium]
MATQTNVIRVEHGQIVRVSQEPEKQNGGSVDLVDPRESFLTNFQCEDTALIARCDSLLAKRLQQNAAIDTLIRDWRVVRRTELFELHEKTKAECRAAQKAVADLQDELQNVERLSNRATAAEGEAHAALNSARLALERLSRFAPAAEIAKCQAAIDEAATRHEKCQQKKASWMAEHNRLALSEFPKLQANLNALSDREQDIAAELRGESRASALGIVGTVMTRG